MNLQENYFLDDGAYGALKIVIEMVRRRLEGQGDIADLLTELRCAGLAAPAPLARLAWLLLLHVPLAAACPRPLPPPPYDGHLPACQAKAEVRYGMAATSPAGSKCVQPIVSLLLP